MPFSADTLDFLFENRMHDSREWFAEHHDRYRKSVLEPLRQLVVALTPSMLSIDGELGCEPKVDRTICRIWRDTRYTHDPSLYRDNMWIIFKRGGRMHGTDYPGFYFDLSGSGFGYGCGFYAASTGYMNTLRGLILEGDPDYRRAQRSLAKCKQYEMDGDFYKRPHYPTARPRSASGWSAATSASTPLARTLSCSSPTGWRPFWRGSCSNWPPSTASCSRPPSWSSSGWPPWTAHSASSGGPAHFSPQRRRKGGWQCSSPSCRKTAQTARFWALNTA